MMLGPLPAFAEAAVPGRYAVADPPDIAPLQAGTKLVLPDRELTAHVQTRLGTWEAIRSLFRSDDAAGGVAPSPRRDLPERAFAQDRGVTGSNAEGR